MTDRPTRRRSPTRRPAPAPSPGEAVGQPTVQDGTFICYADGASRGNPGPAAIGGVVYDPAGTPRSLISLPIGRATNNVAEWCAAVAVLEAALGDGASSVELRMDSELVVLQLRGVYKVRNPKLLPYYEQAKELLSRFTRWEVNHVRRAWNSAADRLANAALDRMR